MDTTVLANFVFCVYSPIANFAALDLGSIVGFGTVHPQSLPLLDSMFVNDERPALEDAAITNAPFCALAGWQQAHQHMESVKIKGKLWGKIDVPYPEWCSYSLTNFLA